jgi:hypothetical protein
VPAPRPPTEPPREPWPEFAKVSAWPALNATAFRSRGHLVKPDHVAVRINVDARPLYLGLVTDTVLPAGTTIALFFTDPAGRERGPIFVMEKVGESWRYFGTDREGRIDPEVDAGACSRCHAGATADGVFGLPRGVEPSAPGLPAEN